MDVNEIFDVDELQEQNKPTLDEIKKIVDNKRNNISKKYSKEDRIKNLELAREKRKNINLDKKTNPVPIPASIPSPIPAPIPAPIPILKPAPIPSPISSIENELMNEIKNMILKQNEILEKINLEPKKRVKKETKKKPENRLLDLTISDKEIKNIIDANSNANNNNINDKKIIDDPKLKMFLDAFKRV